MKQRQDRTLTSEKTIQAFSLSIDELPCSHELYRYLRKHGVAYLGEACRLKRAPQFQRGVRKTSVNWESFLNLLTAYGLRPGYDPVTMGWRPPYWDNSEWVTALSTPLSEVGDFGSWFLLKEAGKGNHCMGQFIRSFENECLTSRVWLQGCHLSSHRFDLFRASMIIPPDWAPMSAADWKTRIEKTKKAVSVNALREQVTNGLAQTTPINGEALPRAIDDVMRAIATVGSARTLMNILVFPAANEQLTERVLEPNAELLVSEIDLSFLALSVRTDNALRTWGKIYTVPQLAKKSKADLLSIRGLGSKGVKEINEALARIGRRK